MLFETLDIVIESRKDAVWLTLSGPFRKESIPNIREKLMVLLQDGNRIFVVNLENLTSIDEAVIQLFLQFLNAINKKGGELKLIFKNETVSRAFSPFSNLFTIYPDTEMLISGSFIAALKRRGVILSRKTGVRLSRPVALFLLIVLSGWFLTLGYIILIQNRQIEEQYIELHDLTQWKQRSIIQINKLKKRIGPLEQLGIVRDTTGKKPSR